MFKLLHVRKKWEKEGKWSSPSLPSLKTFFYFVIIKWEDITPKWSNYQDFITATENTFEPD